MKNPARKVGQVWGLRSDEPGLVLIVGQSETLYDKAWSVLTIEAQKNSTIFPTGGVSMADDVWFEVFAKLVA